MSPAISLSEHSVPVGDLIPAQLRRTWRRAGERPDRVDYVLVGDTSSRGFATIER